MLGRSSTGSVPTGGSEKSIGYYAVTASSQLALGSAQQRFRTTSAVGSSSALIADSSSSSTSNHSVAGNSLAVREAGASSSASHQFLSQDATFSTVSSRNSNSNRASGSDFGLVSYQGRSRLTTAIAQNGVSFSTNSGKNSGKASQSSELANFSPAQLRTLSSASAHGSVMSLYTQSGRAMGASNRAVASLSLSATPSRARVTSSSLDEVAVFSSSSSRDRSLSAATFSSVSFVSSYGEQGYLSASPGIRPRNGPIGSSPTSSGGVLPELLQLFDVGEAQVYLVNSVDSTMPVTENQVRGKVSNATASSHGSLISSASKSIHSLSVSVSSINLHPLLGKAANPSSTHTTSVSLGSSGYASMGAHVSSNSLYALVDSKQRALHTHVFTSSGVSLLDANSTQKSASASKLDTLSVVDSGDSDATYKREITEEAPASGSQAGGKLSSALFSGLLPIVESSISLRPTTKTLTTQFQFNHSITTGGFSTSSGYEALQIASLLGTTKTASSTSAELLLVFDSHLGGKTAVTNANYQVTLADSRAGFNKVLGNSENSVQFSGDSRNSFASASSTLETTALTQTSRKISSFTSSSSGNFSFSTEPSREGQKYGFPGVHLRNGPIGSSPLSQGGVFPELLHLVDSSTVFMFGAANSTERTLLSGSGTHGKKSTVESIVEIPISANSVKAITPISVSHSSLSLTSQSVVQASYGRAFGGLLSVTVSSSRGALTVASALSQLELYERSLGPVVSTASHSNTLPLNSSQLAATYQRASAYGSLDIIQLAVNVKTTPTVANDQIQLGASDVSVLSSNSHASSSIVFVSGNVPNGQKVGTPGTRLRGGPIGSSPTSGGGALPELLSLIDVSTSQKAVPAVTSQVMLFDDAHYRGQIPRTQSTLFAFVSLAHSDVEVPKHLEERVTLVSWQSNTKGSLGEVQDLAPMSSAIDVPFQVRPVTRSENLYPAGHSSIQDFWHSTKTVSVSGAESQSFSQSASYEVSILKVSLNQAPMVTMAEFTRLASGITLEGVLFEPVGQALHDITRYSSAALSLYDLTERSPRKAAQAKSVTALHTGSSRIRTSTSLATDSVPYTDSSLRVALYVVRRLDGFYVTDLAARSVEIRAVDYEGLAMMDSSNRTRVSNALSLHVAPFSTIPRTDIRTSAFTLSALPLVSVQDIFRQFDLSLEQRLIVVSSLEGIVTRLIPKPRVVSSSSIQPIDNFIREGFIRNLSKQFRCPTIFTPGIDKTRNLQAYLGNSKVSYPFMFVNVQSVSQNVESYVINKIARAGVPIKISEDGSSFLMARLIPMVFELEIEYYSNTYSNSAMDVTCVDGFVRRWLFTRRNGGLSYNVDYGLTQVSISYSLSDQIQIPPRESPTETEAFYRVTCNATIHGFISEPELGSVGRVKEILLSDGHPNLGSPNFKSF